MKNLPKPRSFAPSKAWIVAALAAGAIIPQTMQAETLFGLTSTGSLISFDSASPGTLLNSVPVTGLGGDSLIGIDVRPNGGALYAVSTGNFIFTINAATGAATSVGTLSTPTSGTTFGFDFNPVPDRLRVVSTAEQNLRINVGTGGVTVDGALAFAALDANAGMNPNVVGVAYSNNFNGATSTTLYGIDSDLDILLTQNPPNAGTLNTVGGLGVNTTGAVGFDISVSGIGYAALTDNGTSLASLYTINLGTGAATLVGQIGDGTPLQGLTAVPEPEEYGMMFGGVILGFAAYRRYRKQA